MRLLFMDGVMEGLTLPASDTEMPPFRFQPLLGDGPDGLIGPVYQLDHWEDGWPVYTQVQSPCLLEPRNVLPMAEWNQPGNWETPPDADIDVAWKLAWWDGARMAACEAIFWLERAGGCDCSPEIKIKDRPLLKEDRLVSEITHEERCALNHPRDANDDAAGDR